MLQVVFSSIIKPKGRVVDYRTQYSGVTQEILDGVEVTLDEVKGKINEVLHKGSILVGHSLHNDLRVLGIKHDRIIDTAVAFPHRKGPPRKLKLKDLSLMYLDRAIQTDKGGHSAEEDAKAAMELALLQILHGGWYGDGMPHNADPDQDSFLEELSVYDKEIGLHVTCSPEDASRCGEKSPRTLSSEAETSLSIVAAPSDIALSEEATCMEAWIQERVERAQPGALIVYLSRPSKQLQGQCVCAIKAP